MSEQCSDPGTKRQHDEALDLLQQDAAEESATDEDGPASYRDLTKEEVLEGIARGYLQAKAGDYRPIEELFDELDALN